MVLDGIEEFLRSPFFPVIGNWGLTYFWYMLANYICWDPVLTLGGSPVVLDTFLRGWVAGEEPRKPVLPAIRAFNVASATPNVNQGFQILKKLIFRLIDKTVKSNPQNRILL